MKKILIAALMVCLVCLSCGTSPETSSSDGTSTTTEGPTTIDASPYAVSVAVSAGTYNANDVIDNITFDYIISINFTDNTVQLSSGSAQSMTTDGVTPLTVGATSVVVKKTDYGITVNSSLAANIKYDLTGTLNGTLTLTSNSAYQLYLNGVTISASAGPALDLESAQKVYIVAASGTTSTLKDASSRSMTMKAAVYGKGPMILSGDGNLSVTGTYKHGIFSNDYIRVRGTTLAVSVSARDAIRSVNAFIFDDGNLTINATGTTTDDESKGIKVEGVEGTGAGKGYIVINGGTVTVTSVGKAITAGWDIDEDATTTDVLDDPNPYVEINNGVLTLTTTGTPYENASGSLSPEGIEAKTNLTVNNGYLVVNTTDDALNAGKSLTINSGYLYLASSLNDAVDSNGTLTIAGGVIVAVGASVPEGAFDCDQNTFAVTGGTFVGIGGASSAPTAGACKQNTVILGSGTQGKTLAIKAASGSTAFAFSIPQSYGTMILSSPNITTGTKYTVYTGGTASAEKIFKGLYLGSLSYANGTAGKSFTVSSCITNIK